MEYNKMYKKIGLLCALTLPILAYADNCESTRNVYDSIYCTNKVFANADADLNKNYQLLRKSLTEKQKNILKTSQLAWIKDRDNACSDEDDQSVAVECNLRYTQERNHWLIERIRECKTVGCKTSKLYE